MQSLPSVSIIVGCFMQEKYIERAYWSAVNQEYDGELDVVINHDNCVMGQGHGASYARNQAIECYAKGDWIICLDADDFLPSNYVASLVRPVYEEDFGFIGPGISDKWFAGCPVQFVSGRKLARFGNVAPGPYNLDCFRKRVPPIPSAAMFSRQAWADAGGYGRDLITMEDFDFWYRLMEGGNTYVHTLDTCLLKENDGTGKVHRVPPQARRDTITYMNKRYGLELELPETVR